MENYPYIFPVSPSYRSTEEKIAQIRWGCEYNSETFFLVPLKQCML